MPDKSIKRIQDIAKIDLGDEDLQYVYYRMLKGTIEKDDYKKLKDSKAFNEGKTYLPFLSFVNFNGAGDYNTCMIDVGLAPRELLLAIYGKEELVDEIIQRRCELVPKKSCENANASAQFKSEFEGKQKSGIVDVLKYSITTGDRSQRD
jgi:hypothetical protein